MVSIRIAGEEFINDDELDPTDDSDYVSPSAPET